MESFDFAGASALVSGLVVLVGALSAAIVRVIRELRDTRGERDAMIAGVEEFSAIHRAHGPEVKRMIQGAAAKTGLDSRLSKAVQKATGTEKRDQ